MATGKRVIGLVPRQPAATTEPEQPREFPVRLVLILTVDDKPRALLPIETMLTTPPEGQGKEVSLPVDARELMTLLESLVGPAKPTIWTPKD